MIKKFVFILFLLSCFCANADNHDGISSDNNSTRRSVDQRSRTQRLLNGTSDFKFAHVDSDCRKTNHVVETVIFAGQMCLQDNLLIQEIPFQVLMKELEITKNVYTDFTSCISISVPVEHKIYDKQRHLPVDVQLFSEELNLDGYARPAFNPWYRDFRAHIDAIQLPDDSMGFDVTGVSAPELVIDQFKIVYPLSPNEIVFLFQPFVERHDKIALGSDDIVQEPLRDGYYMIRLLFLTPNQEYIIHADILKEVTGGHIYVHFTSNEGFDYTLLERAMLSVEILPVDPSGFIFKTDETCELDMEEMERKGWEPKPFFDHDLVTSPYAGVFSVHFPNWNPNWNLLRKADFLNTDEIIESSEEGRRNKKFDLRKPE